MLKLIYLARRKPGFTPDDFTRRWRMHGAVGMATPFWRHALGYVQAEPIRPAPIAGASQEHDAIACLMVREDTFTAPPILPDDMEAAQAMSKDELETFAAPIPTVSLWVREEVLKPGALGGVTAFLFFSDPDAARATARGYAGQPGTNRLILNLKRSDEALGPMRNTLPFEAIVEISAMDLPGLKAIVAPGGVSTLDRADLAVVTREAVFWDRLG